MDVIAIDTGILLHAANSKLPHHGDAYPILERARNTEFIGCITEQVLFEFYAVATRFDIQPHKVLDELNKYRQVFAMIHPKPDTYYRCLRAARGLHNVLGAQIYDLYLAQTAIDNNIDFLLTFNVKHFKRFKLPIKIFDAKRF